MSVKDIQMEVDIGSEEDDIDDDDDDLGLSEPGPHSSPSSRNRSQYASGAGAGGGVHSLVGSSGAGGAMVFHNVEDKRAHHNLLERKRRDHIKDSFNDLRDSVPDMAGEKSSRAQILHRATEYIALMNERIHEHATDVDRLKRTNTKLEEEVERMERLRGAGKQPAKGQQPSGGAAGGS